MPKNQTMRIIVSSLVVICLANVSFAQESSKTGWTYNVDNKGNTPEVEQIKLKKPSTELKSILSGMTIISGGSFTMGRKSYQKANERDTALLLFNVPKRVSITSFLMNKYEVSNADYRRFVEWVKDSCIRAKIAESKPTFYLDPIKKTLNWDAEITDADSIAIQSFYIQQSERFYKTRCYDASKCLYLLKNGDTINIYPDTTQWVKNFIYSYNEPMTNHYYHHPAYSSYPVVGVNYYQAKAYCAWLSNRLQEALSNQGIQHAFPHFRLPTEAEWEYAALAKSEITGENEPINIYPWGPSYLKYNATKNNPHGFFQANGGAVYDENDVPIFGMMDDGAFHTASCGTYSTNSFGLHDMAGNVSEWVEDVARIPIIDNEFYYDDAMIDVRTLIIKHYENIGRALDTTNQFHLEQVERYSKMLTHDISVVKAAERRRNYARIIKGGSWADPPAYLQSASRVASDPDVTRCTVGFRVAMILPAHLEDYFRKYLK